MKQSTKRHVLQLALDGYGCPEDKLTNLNLIYVFLRDCPEKIGLIPTMKPYVFEYHGKKPEDWGFSGFINVQIKVEVEEKFVLDGIGSISVYTFPGQGYLSLNVMFTGRFDHEKAVDFVTETFGIKRCETNLFNRGPENKPEPEEPPKVA